MARLISLPYHILLLITKYLTITDIVQLKISHRTLNTTLPKMSYYVLKRHNVQHLFFYSQDIYAMVRKGLCLIDDITKHNVIVFPADTAVSHINKCLINIQSLPSEDRVKKTLVIHVNRLGDTTLKLLLLARIEALSSVGYTMIVIPNADWADSHRIMKEFNLQISHLLSVDPTLEDRLNARKEEGAKLRLIIPGSPPCGFPAEFRTTDSGHFNLQIYKMFSSAWTCYRACVLSSFPTPRTPETRTDSKKTNEDIHRLVNLPLVPHSPAMTYIVTVEEYPSSQNEDNLPAAA